MAVHRTDVRGAREVSLTACGGLLRVKQTGEQVFYEGPRGVITGFSAESRKRMIETCAQVDLEGLQALFLTLTFPDMAPSPAAAHRPLENFWRAFYRQAPGSSALWRMELQKRGAPHFHLLIFHLEFFPADRIRELWERACEYAGPPHLHIRCETMRSKRGAMYYVSKYLAKLPERGATPEQLSLSDVAYSGRNDPSTGRWWGILGRKNFPWATRYEAKISEGPAYDALRHRAIERWAPIAESPAGFTVFTEDAAIWLHDAVRLDTLQAAVLESRSAGGG